MISPILRYMQARRNTLSFGGAQPRRGHICREVLGEGATERAEGVGGGGGGISPPTVGTFFSKIRV